MARKTVFFGEKNAGEKATDKKVLLACVASVELVNILREKCRQYACEGKDTTTVPPGRGVVFARRSG